MTAIQRELLNCSNVVAVFALGDVILYSLTDVNQIYQ